MDPRRVEGLSTSQRYATEKGLHQASVLVSVGTQKIASFRKAIHYMGWATRGIIGSKILKKTELPIDVILYRGLIPIQKKWEDGIEGVIGSYIDDTFSTGIC